MRTHSFAVIVIGSYGLFPPPSKIPKSISKGKFCYPIWVGISVLFHLTIHHTSANFICANKYEARVSHASESCYQFDLHLYSLHLQKLNYLNLPWSSIGDCFDYSDHLAVLFVPFRFFHNIRKTGRQIERSFGMRG